MELIAIEHVGSNKMILWRKKDYEYTVDLLVDGNMETSQEVARWSCEYYNALSRFNDLVKTQKELV